LDRTLSPDVLRLLFLVFGMALLVGLTSGAIWIAWKLFEIHVLHVMR